MLYALLRAAAGVALRWYYRRIDVEGLERMPRAAPLLIVVNHPNALVDALLVGWAIPRRVVLTAKSTLFTNPLSARLLAWAGVVPLTRSMDIRAESPGSAADPRRNARAFGALRAVLGRGGAVVIFPEGISHDSPSLAPLRTGAARIALEARDQAYVRDLHVLPVGLTFERKEAPRSRVLVRVGEAIAIDRWRGDGEAAVRALTAEINARLREVTLNYASADDASRAAALAALLATIMQEQPQSLGTARPLSVEVSLATRIENVRRGLALTNDDRLRARVDALVRRVAAFEESLRRHRVALEDVAVSSETRYATPFILREAAILLLAGPLALWGGVNHWLPFHAARAIARRSVQSATDPAMRTIVAGAALVLLFYGAQGVAVSLLAGWVAAALYVVSLPIAADVNFVLTDRRERAIQRARTYLRFRRRPRLQARLQAELQLIRQEAAKIESVVLRSMPQQAVV
jgi:1-acyl-sn-glycerol-3-phosphate acyltransferase